MEIRRTGKLQTGILLMMLVVVILVALILGVTSGYSSYHSTQESIDELILTNGDASTSALDNYINDLRDDIASIAVSGALTSKILSFDEKQSAIEAIMSNRDDIMSLYVVGADGISLNDGATEDIGEDYSEEQFFTSGMAADGANVDVPVYDEWSDAITMSATYHMTAAQGFDGLVCMDIKYDVVRDLVNGEVLGATGYSFLLDPAGNYIAHPDEQKVLDGLNIIESTAGDAKANVYFSAAIKDGGDRLDNLQYNGEDVRVLCSRLKSNDWIFVSITKPAEFLGRFKSQLVVNIIATLACILFAVLLAVFLSRRIAKPLAVITKRMQQMAQGDLHSPIPDIKSKNEIGVLHDSMCAMDASLESYINDISDKLEALAGGDLNPQHYSAYEGDFAPIRYSLEQIQQSMSHVLSGIIHTARSVQMTSHEMAAASEELSGNAVSQAATIDQIDSNFRKINDNLQGTAGELHEMLDKTRSAETELATSSQHMHKMITSMNEISESASSVSNIISAIDDIAFQTNILALNAAVEAARAGQHGRGFSVVADEVRNLAGKSADSAAKTGELIGNAISAVDRGTRSAEASSTQIGTMEVLISEVNKLVARIEQMAIQQAEAAKEISNGISVLNGIVQADSAMSEETASASVLLSQLAGKLDNDLSFFKLDAPAESDD
jgi:methyl-accepting chemotaxis protein